MAAAFVYERLRSTADGDSDDALLRAALDGNLGRIKGIIRSRGIGSGDGAAVFSVQKDGLGMLHCAAMGGHLEVCKYLVEDLGCDPNIAGGAGELEGVTPFMASAHSGDVATVKYLLDHGADFKKADTKRRTVLHHAVCTGSCKVTEFLLSKGVPVDIDCGLGTPLFHAVNNEQDKTLKILLNHHANPNTTISGGMVSALNSSLVYRSLKCMKLLIKAGADVNGTGSLVPPLVFATETGDRTNFVQLLLKAGADPNIPDDLGRLPIELAAIRGCKEEVEMLLPLTLPIPNVQNWSVDGVISYAKFENSKPLDKGISGKRRDILKSQANMAFKRKDYNLAMECYSVAIGISPEPDARLYSNRSLCKLKLGDGEGALLDAYQCRRMQPDWAKACYRQAAAHMLLNEYKQAHDALLDAQKLDPGNDEIERELRKALELMKISPDGDEE